MFIPQWGWPKCEPPDKTVVVTGAGASADCGIPVFRNEAGAIYSDPETMALFTEGIFRRDPKGFYARVAPLWRAIRDARPGPVHTAIRRLSDKAGGVPVITTNVDGLHQRTGVHTVELHGNVRHMTCIDCGNKVDSGMYSDTVAFGNIPYCRECGGVMRPDVVLFGETLDKDKLEEAKSLLSKADNVIVVGTSFSLPGMKEALLALCGNAMVQVIAHSILDAEAYKDFDHVEVTDDVAGAINAL